MKKGLLTIMIAALTILSTEAQNKFGYLNSNELLASMPESVAMQTELEDYAKKLENQLSDMQSEYERKVTEYQQNETTFSDLVKEDKIREIESIQKRMVDFQQSAQQSLAQKESELFTPIRDKAMEAIQVVAKEGNYTYIFDSGAGSFLYVDESENVISKVKSKLGM
jgi:outer membrane protein